MVVAVAHALKRACSVRYFKGRALILLINLYVQTKFLYQYFWLGSPQPLTHTVVLLEPGLTRRFLGGLTFQNIWTARWSRKEALPSFSQ